ncbi:MAG: hypothetical protein ABJZ55_21960 [Fuerstiella sp.]
MCKKKPRKYTEYPIFYGMFTGGIGRPNLLLQGGRRTGQQFGLEGLEEMERVQFENAMTRLAAGRLFRFAYHHPELICPLWNQLGVEEKDEVKHFGGEVIGGTTVSAGLTTLLCKKLPKKLILPSFLVITCHGFMASLWNRKDGPPPPPPSAGGGGHGIAT